MRTITFYSYKGGVGRSLTLANIATELAMSLGKKVFALDVDLEAPGLHYKLLEDEQREAIKQGVVDCIHEFYTDSNHEMPARLGDYVCQVDLPGANGSLWLMPAGNVPSPEYWRRLSGISWHDFFFGSDSLGIPFFLELKERIRCEYNPDFLLIDARTGVTEIGGMAVTLLPDQVICLLAHNPENRDGARAVLQSIKNAPRAEGQPEIEIIPVVTRIPLNSNGEPDFVRDEAIASQVRQFLNRSASPGAESIRVTDVVILHSEPELQVEERLLLGSEPRIGDLPLAKDYRRLFERIIPTEDRKAKLNALLELFDQRARASRLREQGRYDEARRLGEQVLVGLRQQLGEEHPDTLLAMDNLAVVFRDQGELGRARELHEKVLEMRRRLLGEDHRGTLIAMNNVARVLHEQGEFGRARELQEKALAGWRRVGGEERVAFHFMMNLASTLRKQGELERAQELLEQAVAGLQQKLGAEHQEVLRALDHLAVTLHEQEQVVRAREVAEQALEGLRRVLGEQHPWTLTAMANLATIRHAQGELAEARQLRERVLEARRQILGEQHPDTLKVRASLQL